MLLRWVVRCEGVMLHRLEAGVRQKCHVRVGMRSRAGSGKQILMQYIA
jgi:hypothetical protein